MTLLSVTTRLAAASLVVGLGVASAQQQAPPPGAVPITSQTTAVPGQVPAQQAPLTKKEAKKQRKQQKHASKHLKKAAAEQQKANPPQ